VAIDLRIHGRSVAIWIRGGMARDDRSEANFDGSIVNITKVFFQWFLDQKALQN